MQCRKAIAAKTTKFHVTVIHATRDRIRHFILEAHSVVNIKSAGEK
jgi:hypothetical protein